MLVLVRRGAVEPGARQWLRVTGVRLTAQTRTMSRLASGRSEEVQIGTGQGSAGCHWHSAVRLVVAAANLDLEKETAPDGAVAGRGPLEQEYHFVVAAGGLVCEG